MVPVADPVEINGNQICFWQQQKPPSRETLINEYNSFSAAVDLPPKPQYERQRLDDLDLRSPADVQEDRRERGWKQHNNMAEKPHQDFLLPARGNVGHTSSTRSLYEG